MTGTHAGGLKAYLTNIKRDPDFYKRIGRKGGSKTGMKGFALNTKLAHIAGARGGKISRRGPAKHYD